MSTTSEKADSESSPSPKFTNLKLDEHGLPLIPQPSSSPNDPLNWPYETKLWIVVLMSVCAFFGSFALAVMNPAYAQVSLALHISVTSASYIGTISILGAGLACFVWSPLANVYGRRPVLVFAQSLAVVAGFGSSWAGSYGGVLVGRLFAGLGHGAIFVLTVLVISDIFPLHQRGTYIGIATVALINGPHFASLPGGYVASFVSWRWTLILPSITAVACWVGLVLGMPETMYFRDHDDMEISSEEGPEHKKSQHEHERRKSFWEQRKLWGFKHPGRNLKLSDFLQPVLMLRYPSIVFVALYAGVVFTLGSVMPAVTVSALFRQFYGWNSAHTGVVLSLSTTIGGVLGEFIAGPVTDRLVLRSRLRHLNHSRSETAVEKGMVDGEGGVRPEARLHALWPGAILLPLGLVLFGVMIRFAKAVPESWAGTAVAMGMTCFATQVVLTPSIAYVTDFCNLRFPNSGSAAYAIQLLNFTRQTMAFTVGFWSIPFGEKVGFEWSGVTYALVSLLFLVGVVGVMRGWWSRW